MACSGKAPMVTSAAAISSATLIRRSVFEVTAPTVGLTLATANLARRISKAAYQTARQSSAPGVHGLAHRIAPGPAPDLDG
jgi:hypothetical protein